VNPLDLDEVRDFLGKFAADRDWEQYHNPKNLAMALAAEAGELLEVFQWLTPQQSRELTDEQRRAVADEMADVLQYLVRLANVVSIDLAEELWRKLRENEARFPPISQLGGRPRPDPPVG